MITKERFENGYTYAEYRQLTDRLLEEGKTTGDNHSEDFLHYTKMNVQRMSRLDKTTTLDDATIAAASKLPKGSKWLVLSEAWCGDAAQNLPLLQKVAEQAPDAELRILLRDENLDIMDQYLTNGGRAIPKLILMDTEMNELATWGPRPAPVQEMVEDNKRNAQLPYMEFGKIVQKWYAKDKGKSFEREMQQLLTEVTEESLA